MMKEYSTDTDSISTLISTLNNDISQISKVNSLSFDDKMEKLINKKQSELNQYKKLFNNIDDDNNDEDMPVWLQKLITNNNANIRTSYDNINKQNKKDILNISEFNSDDKQNKKDILNNNKTNFNDKDKQNKKDILNMSEFNFNFGIDIM